MWIRQQNEALASDVAQRVDIVTRRAETANFRLKLYDPSTTPGDFDLSGYNVLMSIRARETVLASLLVAGGASGEIEFRFDTAQMDFNPGSYSYTITASEGTDYVKTWLQGTLSHVGFGNVNSYPNDLINKATRTVRVKDKDIQFTILNA
jgi:hypothetical protein